MALPTAVTRKQGAVSRYGIAVLLVPATSTTDLPLYDVEVQRAPDSAGAPDLGNLVTIARLGAVARTGTTFVDPLPNDGTRRHYRWRFVRNSYTGGAYSSWLSTGGVQGVKPGIIDGIPTDAATLNRDQPYANDLQYALAAQDITGRTATGDVYVPSAKTVKVGTLASPSSISKTLRFPAAMFVPVDNVTKFSSKADVASMGGGLGAWLSNQNTFTPDRWACAIPMPAGVTITDFSIRWKTTTTLGRVTATMWRMESDAATSLSATGNLSQGAGFTWQTNHAVISETTTAARHYICTCEVWDTVAGNNTGLMQYVELTYTVPSYDKGY